MITRFEIFLRIFPNRFYEPLNHQNQKCILCWFLLRGSHIWLPYFAVWHLKMIFYAQQEKEVNTPNDAHQQMQDLTYQLSQLQRSYEELQKIKDVLESEHEDLLVLLAEKDQKVNKMKDLLRENKIDFSESESGEEESDDDL